VKRVLTGKCCVERVLSGKYCLKGVQCEESADW